MEIKKETKGTEKEKIVILIPYWSSYGTKESSFDRIKKLIPPDFGYIYYYFTKDLLNSDPFLTKKYFNQFLSIISENIKKLKKSKKREFFIYAQSLGGLFAMIVSDREDIKKCILINPGDNLAESFWNGTATQVLKKQMTKKGITLTKLKKNWETISPDFYFKEKAKKTKFFIKLSMNDKIIPIKNGKSLIELLKSKKIKFNLYETLLPHQYSLLYECLFPRKKLNIFNK
jgi:hypothetical protein